MSRNASRVPANPVNRANLQAQVYDRIVDLILNGGLEPGQTLTINQFAEAYGISPMPVREAMQRLVSAGVLHIVAGRSLGIPALTVERLDDLRKVRCEIEGVAAFWAAERASAKEIKALSSFVEKMDDAVRSGDIQQFMEFNRHFHFTIYGMAGSDTLLSLIQPLWLQISPYFNTLKGSGNIAASNDRHQRIIQALTEKDAETARDLIRLDINEAAIYLTEKLKSALI